MPIHAKKQVTGVTRLTWHCNTDTGQCGVVILVTDAEREWLLKNEYVYENADHKDPDHKFSFEGDLHPMWGEITEGKLVKKLFRYRNRQPYPNNLGPNA